MSKTSNEHPDMKVIKSGQCATLSNKSKLTFQLGTDEDSSLHVRINKNTGGGFFSNEWIAMDDIRAVMEEHPAGTPVTSFQLQPLFHGKSVNTPAFLLAVLFAAKLVYPVKGKKRQLAVVDSDEFTEKVSKLMSSKSSTRKAPTSSKKKAAIKKRAMVRKKTVRTV